MKHVMLELPDGEVDALTRFVAANKVSGTEVVRQALADHLGRASTSPAAIGGVRRWTDGQVTKPPLHWPE